MTKDKKKSHPDPAANLLEPSAQVCMRHTMVVEEDYLRSIAVSLRRIADAQDRLAPPAIVLKSSSPPD